jgi:hypothetical protein
MFFIKANQIVEQKLVFDRKEKLNKGTKRYRNQWDRSSEVRLYQPEYDTIEFE